MKLFFNFRFLSILIALILTCTAQAAETQPPNETTFNNLQKTQIEHIVRDYLLNHPEVLLEAARSLQEKQHAMMAKQAKTAITKNAQQLFADPVSPVIGNPKADITIVEFFDFQCPYCKHMAPILMELVKSDPNIRIVFKQLPIFGEQSEFAAKAALASTKQNKYLAFNNALLQAKTPFSQDQTLEVAKSVGLDIKTLQANMQDSAYTQEITSNEALANALGLVGTPAFVISKVTVNDNKITNDPVNSIFLPNAATLSMLQQAIQMVRNNS